MAAATVALVLAAGACSGRAQRDHEGTGGRGGGVATNGGSAQQVGGAFTAGMGGASGNGGVVEGASGDAGDSSVAGDGGASGAASAGAAGVGGNAGGGAAAGSGGVGGTGQPSLDSVKPSAGCGAPPAQALGTFVQHTIATSGTKDQNCAAHLGGQPRCGPWSLTREYYLWLPPGYDGSRAYPLVFQGPGCGGGGTNVYSLSPTNGESDAGVDGEVIRVGLTPPPNSVGHGTNENQGCFDDKEGDDSVDFVFYEALIDRFQVELCYDENRVFVSGNSTGAWLANELGCKYAGDSHGYAIRGIAPNTGGLPTEPAYRPTCTDQPMAGLWVYETNDTTSGFNPTLPAIERAMKVNQCEAQYFGAPAVHFEDFPIAGQPEMTCGRILDCLEPYPLVVCRLPGNGHGSHDAVYNPAFAAFLRLLAPP